MDKQTFSSIQATTNTSRYAAAVFRKGKVRCVCVCVSALMRLLLLSSVTFVWLTDWLLLAGELHLTPLQGILQMRPSFSYLDKADSKHKEREAANEGKWALRVLLFCLFILWSGDDITLILLEIM